MKENESLARGLICFKNLAKIRFFIYTNGIALT